MSLAEPLLGWPGWGGPILNWMVTVEDMNDRPGNAEALDVPGGVPAASATETKTQFRVSEFPTTPAPRAGEPVVEFRTGQDLLSSGWSRRLIDKHLGEPDGTRPCGRGVRRYYRVDRVLDAEQALDLTGEPDTRTLALKASHLYERGWTEEWIGRFLAPADDYLPTPRWWMGFRVFAVARVEQVEATPGFQQVLAERERKLAEGKARWEAGRAEREAGWAAEALHRRRLGRNDVHRLRDAKRAEELSATFPGFRLNLDTYGDEGVGWWFMLSLGLTAAVNAAAGAAIRAAGFPALVAAWDEAGDWTALKDWLVAHPEVGNTRFRAAVRFLAAGDPSGWREWCEAPAMAA
jgi:hypothetical protein